MLIPKKKKSAHLKALFLFLYMFFTSQLSFSTPLTPSMFVLYEDSFELSSKINMVKSNTLYFKENVSIRIGMKEETTVYCETSLLQSKLDSSSLTLNIGDTVIGLWKGCYVISSVVTIGMFVELGLPTGPNAMVNESDFPTECGYTTLSFGFGGTCQTQSSFIFLYALQYVFLPSIDESIFHGLTLDFANPETYKKLFGFNPWYPDSIFNSKKLRNDVGMLSSTVIYNQFPYIIYFSGIFGNRINNKPLYGHNGQPVLYRGYNSTAFAVLSAGIRYFFSEETYIGIGVLTNMVRNVHYAIKQIWSIECSSIW